MNIDVLRTFVAVAEAGSLSAASNALGTVQSILSRRIQQLESECGAPLFYRHGRGLRLTLAGEALRLSLPPVLSQLASCISDAGALAATPKGEVTAAMPPSFMGLLGFDLLCQMQRRYPDVRVKLIGGYSRNICEWLQSARVEVGLLSSLGTYSSLVAEQLAVTPVILVAHKTYKWPTEEQCVALKDLAQLPLALMTTGNGLRRCLDSAAAAAHCELGIAYEVDDFAMLKRLVQAGRAVSFLPSWAIRDEIGAGDFVSRNVTGFAPQGHSFLATAPHYPITPCMKAAISVIKELAARLLREPPVPHTAT